MSWAISRRPSSPCCWAFAKLPLLDQLLDAIAFAAPKLAQGDAPGFMTAVALKCPPPKPEKNKSESEADKDGI